MDPPSSPMMLLPVELQTRILTFLPFKDIVICSGLSPHFLELVTTSTILQYIIELGISGHVDSGRRDLTTAERLVCLQEHEDAWSTLSWRHDCTIPVGKRYVFWELCGGIFAGSYRSQKISHSLSTFDTIDIFELDSRTGAHPTKTISLSSRFCDFSLDPGQDLLVLVEPPSRIPKVWDMHIKSLSDALAHPSAAHNIIEVPVAYETWPSSDFYDTGRVEIQILGNVVLFSQRRGPGFAGSISVFDWTTGKMTLSIYPPLGDWYCTLISEEHLLLSQRPAFRNPPRLELYDIHPPSKWDAPRITYLLPFGDDDKWRTSKCYGPASFSCTSATPAGPIRPFVAKPQPLLLAFRYIHPSDYEGEMCHLDMFLIPEKLLKYARIGDVIEWDVWGPQSTRWFRDALPDRWQRNIQGYRVALPGRNSFLDFNPHTCAVEEDDVVKESSHIACNIRGFKGIISSLPYRSIRPRETLLSEFVLLGDQVVCVETGPFSFGLVNAFRVLGF